MLVVALSLTAVSTGAAAREFRAADTRSEDYPAVQALRYMDRVIAQSSGSRHLRPQQSALMSGIFGSLGADPFELPYGQVRTGLATKPVDGAGNNRPSFVTTDHAGHYTFAEHTMSPEGPVMPTQLIERIRKVE